MTEDQALGALRNGDPTGLAVLVENHQSAALRLAFAILRDRAEAEDVVADCFLAAYEHIDQLGNGDPFAPWFTRIVINRSLTTIRRMRRRVRILEVLAWARVIDRSADPTAVVELRERDRQLWLAVDALPDNERIVTVLRYYLDLSERQIANLVGCPVGTVKTRLRRGRLRLESHLLSQTNSTLAEFLVITGGTSHGPR